MKGTGQVIKVLAANVAASLLLVGVAGCGGEGKQSTAADFAGSYRAGYTRGAGSILMQVGASGAVRVSVIDGSDSPTPIFYSGTGSTDATGFASITCTSPMRSGSLTLDGSFVAMGSLPPFFEGDLTSTPAGITVRGLTIGQTSVSTANPFVGTWQGSYLLTTPAKTQGTITLTIESGGGVTGTLTDTDQGTVAVTGSVNSVGAMTFAGTSSKADISTFTGGFGFGPDGAKMGVGKWSSTALPLGGSLSLTEAK